MDSLLYRLLFFVALPFAFIALSFITKHKKTANAHLPPSPPALPIIGHLHLLSFLWHQSFQKLALQYGPFIWLKTGGSSSYIVSNGAIAKQVFKHHDISFAARPEFGSSEHQIYKDTLFSTLDYSKYWIFLKKICMVEILSPQQINRFADVRQEEMMKLLDCFLDCAEKGESCDVGIRFMAMTNNLVCRLMMSTRCSTNENESSEIREIAKGITLLSGQVSAGEIFGPLKKYDLLGAGKKIKALLLRFDEFMDGIITQHENEMRDGKKEKKDMMDILLEIADDPNAEMKLTRNGIKGLFLCREDCIINGYKIPKNSRLVVNLYAVNRNPEAWENAAEFVPERYLANTAEENLLIQPDELEGLQGQTFNYVPFGGGRRGCPGAALAAAVLHRTLGATVQCFDWKIKGAERVNMEEGVGFSAAMLHPLICYPVTRANPLKIA
nr:3,9-dihydroxypterocarpan 6A-monooxygenase [Ipomoea batatas]